MRWSFSKEDLLLGLFVVFGVSYPFIIAVIIYIQDMKQAKEGLEELRAFYQFILGLEQCSLERAKEVSAYADQELLKSMGGEEGLLALCTSNRKEYGDAKVKEELKDSLLVVDLVRKEKGMTQRLLRLRIGYQRGEEGIKIKEISYEKGG